MRQNQNRQAIINNYLLDYLAIVEAEIFNNDKLEWAQFRKSHAEISILFDNVVVLTSYGNIVAIYLILENEFLNLIRYTVGKSAVANYHISKFYEYVTESFSDGDTPQIYKYYPLRGEN